MNLKFNFSKDFKGLKRALSDPKIKNIVFKGGRVSSKTWSASEITIGFSFVYPHLDIVVARFTQESQRQAFFEEIRSLVKKEKIDFMFHFGLSPLQIINLQTGVIIYFHAFGGKENRSVSFKPRNKLSLVVFEELSQTENENIFTQAKATYLRHMDNEIGKIISIYNPPRILSNWLNVIYQQWLDRPDFFCCHSSWIPIRHHLPDVILNEIEHMKKHDEEEYDYIYMGIPSNTAGLAIPTFKRDKHLINLDRFNEIIKKPGNGLIAVVIGGDNAISKDKTSLVPFFVFADGTSVIMDIFLYDPKSSGKIDNTKLAGLVSIWITNLYDKYLKNLYPRDPLKGHYTNFVPIKIVMDCAAIGQELVMQLNKVTRSMPFIADKINSLEFTKKNIEANNDIARTIFRMDKVFILNFGGTFDYHSNKFIKGENCLVDELEKIVWNEKRTNYEPLHPDIMMSFIYGAYSIYSKNSALLTDIPRLRNLIIDNYL